MTVYKMIIQNSFDEELKFVNNRVTVGWHFSVPWKKCKTQSLAVVCVHYVKNALVLQQQLAVIHRVLA